MVFGTVAVSFGTVWVTVYFYQLYPLVLAHVVDRSAEKYVDAPDSVADERAPTIDVLLPAYREGGVIHQAIGSIRNAEYPQDRITVNVLVEPDDEDTRGALSTLETEYEFRELVLPSAYLSEVVVPNRYPGRPNKPRALNYGYEMTDGDIVGVIDAEDVVAEDLFRRVAGAIEGEGYDYVQGILDMVNEDDGWRHALFRGEYAFWYRWLLPAFHYAGYPVPLGGTTNFFDREVLREASYRRLREYGVPWSSRDWLWIKENGLAGAVPWDPRNVTEDFELGLLLHKEGFDLGLLSAVTREESPLTLSGWIRQRTRWQRGKVYTFAQYVRTPPDDRADRLHFLLQSVLPHLGPVNVTGVVLLFMIANAVGYAPPPVVFGVLVLGITFVVVAMAFQASAYALASDAPPGRRALRSAANGLTLPAYWFLQWGADIRALVQFYLGLNHWEKTDHHGRNSRDDEYLPDESGGRPDDQAEIVFSGMDHSSTESESDRSETGSTDESKPDEVRSWGTFSDDEP